MPPKKNVESEITPKTEKKSKKNTKEVEEAPVEEAPAEEAPEEPQADAEEVEDADTKKPTKKPTKPKTGTKKPKGEVSEKKKQEDARIANAHSTAAAELLATIVPNVMNLQRKLGEKLEMMILENVNMLQLAEVTKDGDYNPFPKDKFFLFENASAPQSKKAPVRTSSSKPVKKAAPLRRGQKAVVEPVEEEHHSDDEEKHADDTAAEAKSDESAEKKEKLKRIVSWGTNSKNYLCFLLTRYFGDLFDTNGGSKVKSSEDFTKFTFEQISQDVQSHVGRHVVCTVNRLQDMVASISDDSLESELNKALESDFSARKQLLQQASKYMTTYLKLLAYVLSRQLWESCTKITWSMLQAAVRHLDMGNHEYMLANKLAVDGQSDFGLSYGFYKDAHRFITIMTPPESEEKKKARNEKKKASKKPAKGKKAKKSEDEEEPEAEDAEEPEAEADDAEAEAEEPEAEAEDAEPEVEPEEEAPKKTAKKLSKK